LITGEEGNIVICHVSNTIQQQVCTLLSTFTNDKGEYQAPNGRKGHPNPGIPVCFIVDLGEGQVIFFGVDCEAKDGTRKVSELSTVFSFGISSETSL
jgi:hypothetical protein